LAQETASGFPESDDLDDFGAELGDRTVMMPAGLAPALPERQDKPELRSKDTSVEVEGTHAEAVEADSERGSESGPDAEAESKPDAEAESKSANGTDDEQAQADPDATVLISAEEMAGTNDTNR
jgi:hypothetical protein